MRVERAARANDGGSIESNASRRGARMHHGPELDRESLHAVVRPRLHDAQRLRPVAFVTPLETLPPSFVRTAGVIVGDDAVSLCVIAEWIAVDARRAGHAGLVAIDLPA